MPETLTTSEVLRIHDILVDEFARDNDPISPPGLKSRDLLESAVSRQHTGLGRQLKYSDPVDNAATLTYGVCSDHPFHNGNKRTAVVAMLVHLDKNRLTLFGANQNDIYQMILSVAAHTITDRRQPRRRKLSKALRPDPDAEVAAISEWLHQRAKRLRRGEKEITYRELRKILQRFGYDLVDPKGNSIDIVRHVEEHKGLLGRKKIVVAKHVGNIPFPGDTRIAGMRHIKYVRELCNLREEDGVDTESFYNEGAVIDGFVNKYRTVLRRLARN